LSTEASSLTVEQRLVLQMIYDHFHAHASWPTFISIDRPFGVHANRAFLRRAACVQRHGTSRFRAKPLAFPLFVQI
jgi:hypothetical protein